MNSFIYCLALLVHISKSLAGQGGCGHPAVPPHAVMELIMDSDNVTIAKYKCSEPLLLIGNDTRTCDPDLFNGWQGEIPVCALNVAYRKPLLHSDQEELIANDGSTRTCLFVKNGEDPNWKIDLLKEFKIKAVQIWTKKDYDPVTTEYYSSNDVQIFPEIQLYQNETKMIPEENNITRTRYFYVFSNSVEFRYMNIILPVDEASLCEVQVFSADHQELLSPLSCHQSSLAKQIRIYEGICYYIYFIKDGLTWSEAESNCNNMHGHLVTVPNFSIHTFLRWDLLHTTWNIGSWSDHKLVWIGAYKNTSQNTWGWWKESHVSSLWDELSFVSQDNSCLSMSSELFYSWKAWPCENKQVKLYICQKNPINCGIPQQQEHSYILGLPDNYYFKIKEIVIYECEDGFHMQNTIDKVRQCLASGRWTSQAPYCRSDFLTDYLKKISTIVISILLLCVIIIAGIMVWRFWWVKRTHSQWFPSFIWERQASKVSNSYISAPYVDIVPTMMISGSELNQPVDLYEHIPAESIELTY